MNVTVSADSLWNLQTESHSDCPNSQVKRVKKKNMQIHMTHGVLNGGSTIKHFSFCASLVCRPSSLLYFVQYAVCKWIQKDAPCNTLHKHICLESSLILFVFSRWLLNTETVCHSRGVIHSHLTAELTPCNQLPVWTIAVPLYKSGIVTAYVQPQLSRDILLVVWLLP